MAAIVNIRTIGRTECGNSGGVDWTAIYVYHNDRSNGWQITFDHGRSWTPREVLPSD